MTFLAPAALFGALLLAIPIIVHLFKPRKMRATPFSSLRWLKQTHQRLSRRVQWHQWLLFLTRAGCISLLVLALARPLLGTAAGDGKPTDRFVVVDGGRSMAYQARDLPSTWDRARELAGQFLQENRPGDRTALVLTGNPPRLLTGLTADAAPFLANLAAAKPSQGDCTLTAALALVSSLLPRTAQGEGEGQRDTEVIFLTDNLKQRWQQGDIQAFKKNLPAGVRVKVVELGPGSAHNAWIADVQFFKFGPGEDSYIRVLAGYVGEMKHAQSVRLTGISGLADDTEEIVLNPGRLSRVDFKVRADVNLQGQTAELRLEPADGLASDDRVFLNLDVPWALRVLLVEPETLGADGRPIGVNLRTAMETLASSKQQALAVQGRTPATLTGEDIQKADVILLAGVPELTDAAVESLESRVRSGAALIVFLGPNLKAAFYNQKLHRSLQPAEGLLPLALKTGPDKTAPLYAEGNPGRLTNIRWAHPILSLLHDPIQSDLTARPFHIFVPLAGTPGKNDTVLARFDDETPALAERAFGAGRVLLFNTSANGAWSDLPTRRASFVPLVDRMLAYLSGGGLKRSFMAGDSVTLPLADLPAGGEVTVLSPTGDKVSPSLITQRGQTFLRLDDVQEAGVYRVEGAGKAFSFVVNAGRADSSLVPMDGTALKQWWAPVPCDIVSGEKAAQGLAQRTSLAPVWPLLILLAGLLLVVETVYVARLCPRANPKPAAAVGAGK